MVNLALLMSDSKIIFIYCLNSYHVFLRLFVILQSFLRAKILCAGDAVTGRLLDLAVDRLHLRLVFGHAAIEVVKGHGVQLRYLSLQVVSEWKK